MPVLGCGGKLKLRREAPGACVITSDSVDWNTNTFDLECPGYWSGDRICIFNEDGLPIDGGDGQPGNRDGVATYFGGRWFVALNRDHIDADTDNFYKTDTEEYPAGQAGNDANFYFIGSDANGDGEINGNDLITNRCYYIHIDELGRVSFYTTRCSALIGDPADRVDLLEVDFGFMLIAPYGHLDYLNAVWACAPTVGAYLAADVQENNTIPIDSICDHPPLYQRPAIADPATDFDNADVQPRSTNQKAPFWEILCGVREWTLELDAPSVDTTSVGEKFGEAVKSLVTGGGSVDFFIEKQCLPDGRADSLTLMQLLLMTQSGAEADAEFYLLERDGDGDGCGTKECGDLPGDLYYKTSILITRNAMNMRPTELVAGTANFVTTGEIRLATTPD